jgi:hypothetical protein
MQKAVLIAGIAVAAGAVAWLAWPAGTPAPAPQTMAEANIPDFSGYWTRDGENPSTFEPPPDGPSGIMTAVEHYGHCVVGGGEQVAGGELSVACPEGVTENRASNAWIADTDNPILQPWTREALLKNRRDEEKGIAHLSFQQNCKPSGVPQILNLRYAVQLLQTEGQTTILYENNQQIRRVYMNEEHPADLKPSWYGHSVGHYEGDELVIDTVAQVEFTELDRFGTLHSDQLHVVERYRMLDDGRMRVMVTVTDPKAFTMPWRVQATYKRLAIPEGFAFPEFICAENNRPTYPGQVFDTPTDTTPDF